MYSVIDIIKALSLLIEVRFPAYPVNDRDLTEGFDRPSYFIDVDRVETTDLTAYLMQEESDIVLYFFEEDIQAGDLRLRLPNINGIRGKYLFKDLFRSQ